ncbi:MAG TPA: phenylalanine--tRNA ligase subunit alpha [Methanospirillum sp.]|uniref:phenylalanine--tRNA ligase subunit alpha n=1 Tax=Methanospirillum sp. TaxID=45200 RepID=UPI002B7D61E7|nr:phenylalanine--tRNA ligase subunit alpha [Methanospirillum sp.]HOJ96229.1 phenylalanine--tRNA ligase subunit alpha [Methanospirillum sp.]HOL41124.1 phenylalanine--tRNA ligase subunit alpha [Methanospirillum sp.]HPP77215.1 phenylalanine--tRNA ligase subunit alpha [Methanospirillum sp.]
MQLTLNEKRLLLELEKRGTTTPDEIGKILDRPADSVIQYGGLLSQKGLARVDRSVTKTLTLTDEGRQYLTEGLPERQLYNSFGESAPITELNNHPHARIGLGWMKRLGWVKIEAGKVIKTGQAPLSPLENSLKNPNDAPEDIKKELLKRGLATEEESVRYTISITDEGRRVASAGISLTEETGTLTADQISSGAWKDLSLRRYDITKHPRPIWPGKIHPYQRMIDEMRRILLDMGFTELHGSIIQGAFWNFDALFQPQDHPAREMQDTFHLAGKQDLPDGWEKVRDMHESGGDTSSTGWGGTWDPEKAKATVLRTHTTSLSIQHLATHPEPPVKAFCIGRVYRREAIDPTHLPEFEQLEGIVMDTHVNFRNLLGYLKEFYGRMGFESVRFRPGYFPYTEPSVEPEVYIEDLGWVELGGAGIFREEVTAPWGITCPVLAWGLGVSRVAMLRMGLTDLRELYQSDIDWIRSMPVVHGGRC